MFNFIEGNVARIWKAEEVNCIVTRCNANGRHLVACMVDGREITLTSESQERYFPMVALRNAMGDEYMQNFVVIGNKDTCVNRNNIAGFTLEAAHDKAFQNITATFKSGQNVTLYPVLKRFGFAKRELEEVNEAFGLSESENG